MRLISRKQVRDRVGISFAEIDRRMREKPPRFPLPVKDGRHHNSRVFWVEDEIDDYINDLIAERDRAHAPA